MPKFHSKSQLLEEMQHERLALKELLDALTPVQMTQPEILGDWSVKDVLAHLVEWEQMFLGWYAAGLRGEIPPTPAPGFNWGQLPALNQQIYEKHRQRPLSEVLEMFEASYLQTRELAHDQDENDLLTPGLYPWMRQNTLATYIGANTCHHYRWARIGIRKGLRVLAKAANP